MTKFYIDDNENNDKDNVFGKKNRLNPSKVNQ